MMVFSLLRRAAAKRSEAVGIRSRLADLLSSFNS